MTEDEIVLAGLTENRLGVGLGVIALFSEGIRQLIMNGQVAFLERTASVLLLLPWVPLLGGMAVIALVFSLAASFIFSLQAFWDFTLRWEGDQLEVERGLLFRHRDTVPLQRIQAVQVIENPLRRLLGLASVRVLVGGRVAGGDGATANVLLPAGRRDEAFRLAQEVVGLGVSMRETPVELGPMPQAARHRRWFRGFLVSAAIGVGGGCLAYLSGTEGLALVWAGAVAGAVALPFGLGLGEAAWRGLGWGRLGEEHLGFREGVLTRTTTMVPLVRVQSVEVTSNPLQRRRGLATLIVPVARPPLGSDPRGLDLEAEEAEALRTRLLV
jgi:putative membrane protein